MWVEVKACGCSIRIYFYQNDPSSGRTDEYSSCEIKPEYWESFKHQLHSAIEKAKKNRKGYANNELQVKRDQIEKLKAEVARLQKEVVDAS